MTTHSEGAALNQPKGADAMTTNEELEAEIQRYGVSASLALKLATPAFEELLHLAETRDSGQIPRVAKFIAATYNGRVHSFDLFELRCLNVEISDKMLICLDCLRWGNSDLFRLVPNGDARVRAVIEQWGLQPVTIY